MSKIKVIQYIFQFTLKLPATVFFPLLTLYLLFNHLFPMSSSLAMSLPLQIPVCFSKGSFLSICISQISLSNYPHVSNLAILVIPLSLNIWFISSSFKWSPQTHLNFNLFFTDLLEFQPKLPLFLRRIRTKT